jgi:hypothetical protein
MVSYFDKNVFATTACFGDTTMIYTLNRQLFDSIRWEITDPVTGVHTFSNCDTIYHLYSQPGKYNVHCYRYQGQYVDDFVKKIQVLPWAEFIGQDTTFCVSGSVELGYIGDIGEVKWYNQNNTLMHTGQQYTVSQEGSYYPVHSWWNICGDQPDTVFVEVINLNVSIAPDTLTGNCITNKYYVTAWLNVPDVEFLVWNTGEFWFTINPASTGMYTIYVSGHGCEQTDSVYVIYDEPLAIDFGDDMLHCNESALLEMNNPAGNYLWLPGNETTPLLTVNTTGEYIGIATNACGSYSDTIFITIATSPDIIQLSDIILCPEDTLLVSVPLTESSYQWSTGDTTSYILVSNPGVYSLTVSNICGSETGGFMAIWEEELMLDLPDTLYLQDMDTIMISSGVEGVNYLWSTGETSSEIWVSVPGVYSLTLSNSCFNVSDSVIVLPQVGIEWPERPDDLVVYPNPFTGEITVRLPFYMTDARIEILTISGQSVYSQTSSKPVITIHPDELRPGIYLLRITHPGRAATLRLMKM